MVSTNLVRSGFRVEGFFDGKGFYNALMQKMPDLVILDVQMPEMDGFEVFQEMKKDEELKAIPVVMLTGIREKMGIGFSSDDMKDYMGDRPTAYIEKPIDPAKLIETVSKVLPE